MKLHLKILGFSFLTFFVSVGLFLNLEKISAATCSCNYTMTGYTPMCGIYSGPTTYTNNGSFASCTAALIAPGCSTSGCTSHPMGNCAITAISDGVCTY